MLPILEATAANDSGELTTTDGWLLRVSILLYGLFCLTSIMIGLQARNDQGWRNLFYQMLTVHRSFTYLAGAACVVVTIFMIRPLFTSQYMNIYNPKEIWYMVVGIGHVFYGLSQGRISFQRIPRVLLSPRQNIFITALPYILATSLLSRLVVNCIVIGMRAKNDADLPLQIVCLVIGVISNLVFSGTEAAISILTRSMMTPSLATSNPKMYNVSLVLSQGNRLALCASLLDAVNHFLLSEVLEAIVILIGAFVTVLYSRLMRPEGTTSQSRIDKSTARTEFTKSAARLSKAKFLAVVKSSASIKNLTGLAD